MSQWALRPRVPVRPTHHAVKVKTFRFKVKANRYMTLMPRKKTLAQRTRLNRREAEEAEVAVNAGIMTVAIVSRVTLMELKLAVAVEEAKDVIEVIEETKHHK